MSCSGVRQEISDACSGVQERRAWVEHFVVAVFVAIQVVKLQHTPPQTLKTQTINPILPLRCFEAQTWPDKDAFMWSRTSDDEYQHHGRVIPSSVGFTVGNFTVLRSPMALCD